MILVPYKLDRYDMFDPQFLKIYLRILCNILLIHYQLSHQFRYISVTGKKLDRRCNTYCTLYLNEEHFIWC